MNKLLLYGYLSLTLLGCHTFPDKNVDTRVEDVKALNKIELTDTYHLFEKEGDLYFVLTLKNNTSKTIEVSSTIKPFNLYRQNYESVKERYVMPYPGPFKEIIKIAPSDSHDFEFMINDYYILEEGENVYGLYYFFNEDYSYDYIVEQGYKKVMRDTTIFNFTWKKEPKPNSIKGKLISYEPTGR